MLHRAVRARERKRLRSSSRAAALLPLLCTAVMAQVDLKSEKDRVAITIDGQPFTNLYLGPSFAKPFLWPLRSVAGVIVTRRWPIEEIATDSHDHPHHRGLWIGYGDINGINFWESEPESKVSPENPSKKGTVRLKKLDEAKSGSKAGHITATFSWQDPEGKEVLEEQRTFTFYRDADIRRIDVDTQLEAKVGARFADTKEGFFAIRVADSLAGKNGGILTNSEGAQTEKDVWGKRADWVDYVGTADNQKVGILIMDDARNFRHPPHWHARDYGLFAVNPFGERAFDPKAGQGGTLLTAGHSLRFRYRVIIHSGDVSKKTIAAWYAGYRLQSK